MEWISVQDRRPKNRQRVLLMDEDNWVFTGYFERGKFENAFGDEPGTQVTHWMLLPEPPKEE